MMRIAERTLLAGVLFEFIHLTILFNRRAEVDGTAMAVLFTIGVPLLVGALTLGVTRRRSWIAWLVLAVLVALAAIAAAMAAPAPMFTTTFGLMGAAALLCEVVGVVLTFLMLRAGGAVRSEGAI